MATVLVYRPLGEHPPRTKMGDLELGVVHSIDEAKAGPYLNKGFVVLPTEAKTAKPEAISGFYAIAKQEKDAADAKAKAEATDVHTTLAEPVDVIVDQPVATRNRRRGEE